MAPDLRTSQPAPSALVTGAAGGLGEALTLELARQGWQVGAGWRREKPQTASDSIAAIPLDVEDSESTRSAVQSVVSRWGGLDLAIHNAGITMDAPIWQLRTEAFEKVVQVNLNGGFRFARAVLEVMRPRQKGHLIFISSFAAKNGHYGQSNYVAAKAGLLGLTQALAKEAGPWGVQVNAILPGVLATAMTAHLTEEQRAALAGQNALNRLNSTEETARFAAFLAQMRNVSGQIFNLDSRVSRWT